MDASKWLVRLIEAAVVTVALAAICQELEKPREERHWHGQLGFIPYDFRIPTTARIKERWWNDESEKIFMPATWGIGWSINIFALLERMSVIGEYYVTEDDFLMPTPTLKKILENRPILLEE